MKSRDWFAHTGLTHKKTDCVVITNRIDPNWVKVSHDGTIKCGQKDLVHLDVIWDQFNRLLFDERDGIVRMRLERNRAALRKRRENGQSKGRWAVIVPAIGPSCN